MRELSRLAKGPVGLDLAGERLRLDRLGRDAVVLDFLPWSRHPERGFRASPFLAKQQSLLFGVTNDTVSHHPQIRLLDDLPDTYRDIVEMLKETPPRKPEGK
jgi:hypothetical protein